MKKGEHPKKVRCGGYNGNDSTGKAQYKTLELLNKDLEYATKEPGRYHINWVWKGQNYGHIIVAEKYPNGGLRLFDPQSGEIIKWSEESKRIDLKSGVLVLRVDGLLFDTSVIPKVVKQKLM